MRASETYARVYVCVRACACVCILLEAQKASHLKSLFSGLFLKGLKMCWLSKTSQKLSNYFVVVLAKISDYPISSQSPGGIACNNATSIVMFYFNIKLEKR